MAMVETVASCRVLLLVAIFAALESVYKFFLKQWETELVRFKKESEGSSDVDDENLRAAISFSRVFRLKDWSRRKRREGLLACSQH